MVARGYWEEAAEELNDISPSLNFWLRGLAAAYADRSVHRGRMTGHVMRGALYRSRFSLTLNIA